MHEYHSRVKNHFSYLFAIEFGDEEIDIKDQPLLKSNELQLKCVVQVTLINVMIMNIYINYFICLIVDVAIANDCYFLLLNLNVILYLIFNLILCVILNVMTLMSDVYFLILWLVKIWMLCFSSIT